MKKYIIPILIMLAACCFSREPLRADNDLAQKLAGRILLQVEQNGEAWYVNPADQKRYFLGRPADAFALMGSFGLGITNDNLEKISVGLLDYGGFDSDSDGLPDALEEALGTNPLDADTDRDGYSDKTEILSGYDPLGPDRLLIGNSLSEAQVGRILLQVENRGQAWYLNPADLKRYYLGRPAGALVIMSRLGLGITDADLSQIPTARITAAKPAAPAPTPITDPPYCPLCQPAPPSGPDAVFSAASAAIRTGDTFAAKELFTPEMEKAVEYTMNFLDAEGKFTLGNIMAGARLAESTEEFYVYATEVYFGLGGYSVPLRFRVAKQDNGTWKVANL